MAAVMFISTHDFATKWEMEAHMKRDLDDMARLQDRLLELGMLSAELGVLANTMDNQAVRKTGKFRHTGVMRFKDIEAYQKCMEALQKHDWGDHTKEISSVFRGEVHAVVYEIKP